MYYGYGTKKLMQKLGRDDECVREFKEKVKKTYLSTGQYLQKKLPLANKILLGMSALDPTKQN